MKNILWVATLWAVSALGADVSGKWTGTFEIEREGEKRSVSARMELTQDGNVLTGTVGPEEDTPLAIKGGKIEGATIRFEVQLQNGDTIGFELTVEGDHISGQAKGEHEGEARRAKVDLKRAS